MYTAENTEWLKAHGFEVDMSGRIYVPTFVHRQRGLFVHGELFSSECYLQIRGQREVDTYENFEELKKAIVALI